MIYVSILFNFYFMCKHVQHVEPTFACSTPIFGESSVDPSFLLVQLPFLTVFVGLTFYFWINKACHSHIYLSNFNLAFISSVMHTSL